MKGPEEDKDAKEARKRERRMSMLEQRRSAEEQASGMTMDTNRVYGFGNLGGASRRSPIVAAAPTSSLRPELGEFMFKSPSMKFKGQKPVKLQGGNMTK